LNLPEEISLLKTLVLQLMERVKELEEENAFLKAQLNENSRNSNRPPSSDGFKKKPAIAKPKGKQRGGQRGHKGKTLEMVATPDIVKQHAPQKCLCGQSLRKVKSQVLSRRQVFDLPAPKLEVTEHQLVACVCPNCERLNVGDFPIDVVAGTQYGSGVKSLVTLLNTSLNVPFKKIRQFFKDVYGADLNEATQQKAQQRCADLLNLSEAQIREQLINAAVSHFDETGMRVAGKLHWLHNCSNAMFTYLFVHPKRGKEALDDPASILPDYQNWAIHDCWPSYFKYTNCQHGLCGAHLLRELQSCIERGSSWAIRMHALLMYTYEKSEKGNHIVSDYDFIDRQYKQICASAQKEEPPPQYRYKKKRPKKTKGRNLLERLVKYQSEVLAFARYAHIPFTNNQAERDVRPAKIKLKVATSFRTLKGAQVYARIQSFISTTRKHQLNVFNELVATFNGYNFLTPI